MLKTYIYILVVVICLCFTTATSAQQKRGASTPEERKTAVQMVNSLEKLNPFAKQAKDYRASLFIFLGGSSSTLPLNSALMFFGESNFIQRRL